MVLNSFQFIYRFDKKRKDNVIFHRQFHFSIDGIFWSYTGHLVYFCQFFRCCRFYKIEAKIGTNKLRYFKTCKKKLSRFRNGKGNSFFPIQENFLFFKKASAKFLILSCLIKNCSLLSKYRNNEIPLTRESIFNEFFNQISAVLLIGDLTLK